MCDLSLIDPAWEMMDPNPNIWALFADFDQRFFNGKLTSSFVELMWSSGRMTSTAGLCCWNPRTNFAQIKLSQPLLQLRSRADLVETLLHEMIHAFLFVTRQDDNHESHGPKFHLHMYRINKEAGTNITVFHTFHDEVRHYQQHVWRCDGPCATRPPYYGYVRRANNRKPGSYDYWWATHQANCGGTFNKISEPEKAPKPPKAPSKSKSITSSATNNKRIDDFFKVTSPNTNLQKVPESSTSSSNPVTNATQVKSSPFKLGDIRNYISPVKSEPAFPGKGHRLGTSFDTNPTKRLKLEDDPRSPPKLPDLIPQTVNEIPDDEDSFTYDLPDIDDSIIIESIYQSIENQAKDKISQKPTDPEPSISSSSSSSAPKPSGSSEKSQEDEDDEDVFTYDLPNFTPFFGTGFKLSSNGQTNNHSSVQKPQIINLD